MHVLRLHTYSTQVVKKEYYPHGIRQFSFVFAFKEDFISLKIPEENEELNGWKITPYYKPKVSSVVDNDRLRLQNNTISELVVIFLC